MMVLVPGFEPGSPPRKGGMMDRTTPHKRWADDSRPPPITIRHGGLPVLPVVMVTDSGVPSWSESMVITVTMSPCTVLVT